MAPSATSHRREIELEDLCGLRAPEAIAWLRKRELRPAVEPCETDDPARRGCVLEQYPCAGARVRHGQLIVVIVGGQPASPGPEPDRPLGRDGASESGRRPGLAPAAALIEIEDDVEPPAAFGAVEELPGVEEDSDPLAGVPEPELSVAVVGGSPSAAADEVPRRSRGPGGGSRAAMPQRRRRWVLVLVIAFVLLCGASLLAGQRRAPGSRIPTPAAPLSAAVTTSTSKSSVAAVLRATRPRPVRPRALGRSRRRARPVAASAPAAVVSATAPVAAPVVSVPALSSSPAPMPTRAPAVRTPAAAAAVAASTVSRPVVVPPSANGPLAGPYPNQ